MRVVKQLVVYHEQSQTARSKIVHLLMKGFYCFFFFCFLLTISSSCLFIPRCKKDDENPIIKGKPRQYNEAECNLRRAYSDMFRITNPCYLRTHFSRQIPGTSVFLDSNACLLQTTSSPHFPQGQQSERNSSEGEIKPHEKDETRSPPRLAFLAWDDFQPRSRFARSNIPGQKWGQGCNDSYSLRFDAISIIVFRFRLFRFDYVNVS